MPHKFYVPRLTLKMVGVKQQATVGLAVINSLKIRFKMSAGGKISQVMTGIIRPKSSASRSVPRFILRKWKIKKQIQINN
jgi:hypothetical protein